MPFKKRSVSPFKSEGRGIYSEVPLCVQLYFVAAELLLSILDSKCGGRSVLDRRGHRQYRPSIPLSNDFPRIQRLHRRSAGWDAAYPRRRSDGPAKHQSAIRKRGNNGCVRVVHRANGTTRLVVLCCGCFLQGHPECAEWVKRSGALPVLDPVR